MDSADIIWNRAATQSAVVGAQAGDLAIAAVLRMHSLAMSGGLLDAIDRLDEQQREEAERGYSWLGLDRAAEVIRYIRAELADGALDQEERGDALEREADERYAAIIPTDGALVEAFRRRLEQDPGAFART